MRIDASNLLVIVLISSRRVSATIAWLHPDQGEKVVAHKAIDCHWQSLTDRGRNQVVADAVQLASDSAGVQALSAYIAMADHSLASTVAIGIADLGQDMPLTQSDRDQALLRARHQAIGDDRELVHALPVLWTVRSRQGEREVPDPIGERGSRLTVHALLITARKGYRDELARLLDGCGLHLDGVIAPPLALWHGISGKLAKRGNALVVDVGARHTSIIVHRRGRLWFLQSYPFGGDTLTARLADELKIPPDHAEDLKFELDIGAQGSGAGDLEGQQYLWRDVQERHRLMGPAARVCATALREFFAARVKELRAQELIAQSGQVHLVGRGAALGGMASFLREIFDLPVVLGTGARDREPSAELVDLLISGVVRAAADERRGELAERGSGMRHAVGNAWGWLVRSLE
ncbi:MAG TPA: cell division FtsA domain-containing protein [Planctomycetota bacterium]|nr:cell division FtsA domain-containing protein [Planctomycetota bacterium]